MTIYWYRFEMSRAHGVATNLDRMGRPVIKLRLCKLKVLRETPKGVQLIGGQHGRDNPRLVLHSSKKKFAHPDPQGAWRSFEAKRHMQAQDFLAFLGMAGVQCDVALFDPPYSPRQVSEVYNGIGQKATTSDTQTAKLYRLCRDALDEVMKPGGIVLSFGWNSAGMGVKRRYEIEEILLVAHGGAHNDTICVVERKCL